ncbi:MAG: hypothetical protein ACT4N2_12410 [Hyphomicrobium sp.]
MRGDTAVQTRLDEIDEIVRKTWQQVNEARQAAQRFRLVRAEIEDIIAEGNCAGTPSVLARLARQDTETNALLGQLNDSCARVPAGSQGKLAATCAEERSKLTDELKLTQGDRDALKRLCPAKAN